MCLIKLRNIKVSLHHLTTYRVYRQFKSASMENKSIPILHGQFHDCWWPSSLHCHGINRHAYELFPPDHSFVAYPGRLHNLDSSHEVTKANYINHIDVDKHCNNPYILFIGIIMWYMVWVPPVIFAKYWTMEVPAMNGMCPGRLEYW